MSEWKECKLGDILNLITKGTTPPKGVGFVDQGINYVKSDAIGYDRKLDKTKIVQIDEETHQKFKRSQLAENDILFSMAGIYLGKNAIVTKNILPANTNQALAILRLNQEKANPIYVSLYLSQQILIDYVNNMSGQSAQPNVNFEEIKSIEILLPPLPEQNAIASILCSLDDKIDLLNRQNVTLEKMAETLFRQMMSEHDSLRLHDGQDDANNKSCPSNNPENRVQDNGEEVLFRQMVSVHDSLRLHDGQDDANCRSCASNNPENRVQDNDEEAREEWKEMKLGDLVTITSSKRIFYSEYVSFGIPFYRSKEIIELHNTGSTNSELFISNERFKDIFEKFGAPVEGDILLTSVGTLGIPYKVKKTDMFYFKDGNLTWFKDFKQVSSNIIYCWLKSRIGKEQLDGITIGSTQPALTISGLKNVNMILPPKKVILLLDGQLENIYLKIERNQTQIRTLTALRDTLLPKLMSGEVKVSEHD